MNWCFSSCGIDCDSVTIGLNQEFGFRSAAYDDWKMARARASAVIGGVGSPVKVA